MNKLSADYLMDIARNHSDGDNEKYNMLVDALSEICNFYDAQIDKQGQDIDKAFQILRAYGVTEERAGTVANGIDVLVTRLGKETKILLVNQQNDFHDAQAKTMEQIALTKLEDCKVASARVKKFMADYKIDTDRDMIDIFEAKLAGFLAAGGTIKDGE